MAIVIDDQLLLDVLAGQANDRVESELARGGVYTTGCWYFRLSRATSTGSGSGELSGRMAELSTEKQRRARVALVDLPPEIGLLSLRLLVPVMQELRVRRSLNLLNAEALAAAVFLDAELLVSVDAPLLRSGAEDVAAGYRVAV